MSQLNPFPNHSWARVIDALPLAVVVLDRDGHCRYYNRASITDPLLAPMYLGSPAIPGLEENTMFRQAIDELRARCAEGTQQCRPLYLFSTTHHDRAALCVPVSRSHEEPPELLIISLDVSELNARAAGTMREDLAADLTDGLLAPMASLVSLIGSLEDDLGGPELERVRLISQKGQLMLGHLHALATPRMAPKAHDDLSSN